MASVTTTTCDLCGHSPANERRSGYDFCRFCVTDGVWVGIESGAHYVTRRRGHPDGWECSCGETRRTAFPGFYLWDPRAAALPDVDGALALIHLGD